MATEVQSSAPASTPAEDDETWLYGGKNVIFKTVNLFCFKQ